MLLLRRVLANKPASLTIENVPEIMKTQNRPLMTKQLEEAGYEISVSIRRADLFGLPQARKRFWCHGRLKTFTSLGWQARYQSAMDEMAVGLQIPISKCLLPDTSDYLQNTLASYKAKAKKHDEPWRKWRTDHWVVRRQQQLLPPNSFSHCISEIMEFSNIPGKELDFLRLLDQKGVTLQDPSLKRPAIELKHSKKLDCSGFFFG